MNRKTYVGIHDDVYGGMSDVGRVIRDAWAFGILPESETCAGWDLGRLSELWAEVQQAWQKYNYSVVQLPDKVRQRYERIQGEAFRKAKEAGWDPSLDDDE